MRRREFKFLTLISGITAMAALAACGGGGGGGGTPPTPSPTSTPTPNAGVTSAPASAAVFCDVGNPGNPQSRTRAMQSILFAERTRRIFARTSGAERYVPGVVSVTYNRDDYRARRDAIRLSATQAGAQLVRELDFGAVGRVTQLLRVPEGQEASIIARLKSDPAVVSAEQPAYRHLESATAAFTNDPYMQGFTGSNTPPFYEASSVPGQWDLHVMCAANAWGYANASNGTGTAHSGAAGGSASVPIAIIDTGADLTHPDLNPASRITFAEQVINGKTTPGVATMHDDDGHGTDVAGIAAATGNNSIGFAGVAYNASLMIFKVFPDPPCGSGGCEASSSDIATAINDAVTNGAKVINLSLGANTPATDEENAVANAIAQGVIVVAAAGNGNPTTGLGNPALDYPAADPGVIAVGSSAIDDTNASSPNLKVASYSNYASGSSTWGVIAPGGDPCPGSAAGSPCNDTDDLHWIENIYSSTASQPGTCGPDYGSSSGNDCRVLIAGTSQATPHVAGAVALLLSVGAPQNPTAMKNLLCNSTQTLLPTATNASHQGCGEVDIYRAMAAELGDPTYP